MKRELQKVSKVPTVKHHSERIKQTLAKNHACYVLITCDEASEDGLLQVQMSYEGDATVASYLLQDAQSFIDEQENN